MLCILLDRETRSDKECDGLETASSGKLRFLETRMLENYLLSAEAVAAALGELGVSITPEAAHDELCAALRVSDLQGDLRQVDAASALKTVFTTLSNTVEEFRKTRDVPTMVGFLIEHEPSHLRPLKAYLRSLFRLSAMS